VPAGYREIRAGIRRVLRLAAKACTAADLKRAAKHIGLGSPAEAASDDSAADMVVDIALFEPNQRGRRPYDTFLAGLADQLDAPDRALAERMAAARFSLFRSGGRHPDGGLWLIDLMDDDRRIWLMDEALASSSPDDLAFGLRVFDAGPFHAGFGIVVPTDDETRHVAVSAARQGVTRMFRYSLAATVYGDYLQALLGPTEQQVAAVSAMLELLDPAGQGIAAKPLGTRSRLRRAPKPIGR
jgi:hypothetical protein